MHHGNFIGLGESSKVRAESLENNLSDLLNMSEDALEALDMDNESVDPTFDAEASKRMMLVRGLDFVPLLDSDQRISLGICYHFNWESYLLKCWMLHVGLLGRYLEVLTWKIK